MRLIGLALAAGGLIFEKSALVVIGALVFGASYVRRDRFPAFARNAADSLDAWAPTGNARGPVPAQGPNIQTFSRNLTTYTGTSDDGKGCGCGG